MLGIWTSPETGTDPPVGPGYVTPTQDARFVHEYPVYAGRTDESYNLRDAETARMNAGLGPSRVPVFLGSVQFNQIGSQLGYNWGFRYVLRGQTSMRRAATVQPTLASGLQSAHGNPPGPVPVHEPSYLPPVCD